MAYIECLKPGLLTTVQDLGRENYQSYGISVSGAMDRLSMRLANILVGNAEGQAVLEAAIIGPELLFTQDGIIALTGAEMSSSINERRIPMWKTIKVQKGDILHFGKLVNGSFTYIGFAGGIQVRKVLGSRSTFIRGSYGGLKGRPLRKGDKIQIGNPAINMNRVKGRTIPYADVPDLFNKEEIHFIWGPHDNLFTNHAKDIFCRTTYKITAHSDRMGYRLSGEVLAHRDHSEILSDYIAQGAIQVPGDGQPIVLMADCQMSGGYTKIGMVIGVDLPAFSQKKTGDTVRFNPVSIEEAQAKWRKQEIWLAQLAANN